MKSSKKHIRPKCLGCGLQLSSDPNNLGYAKNDQNKYCQRCFQLMHYGFENNVTQSKDQTNEVLNQLKIIDRDAVFLLMDVLNFDCDLLDKFSNIKQLVIIVTKCDQILNNKNYQIFQKRFQELIKLTINRIVPIFLSSSVNNLGLKKLTEYIFKLPLKTKIYLIGKTNSGKSSLINSLFKFNDCKKPLLTTSNFVNTTIGFNKIKFFKHTLIDTPGFWSEGNIQQVLLDPKMISDFQTKKPIKPISFQLQNAQSLFFDSLLRIDVNCNQSSSFNCYLSNLKLKIHRTKTSQVATITKNNNIFKYKINKDIELTTYTFEFDPTLKYNLMIDGLGLICFKRVNQLKIFINKNVKLSILKRNLF